MALAQTAPEILELRSIVQFPNFKPGSDSLVDFLNTFASNSTTHTIRLSRHFTTGFSDEEFCQILRAFGRLSSLRNITFVDGGDSRLRRLHIVELARLIQSAPRLQTLIFGRYWLLTGNDGERMTLARALAHHPALQVFHYDGCGVKQPQSPITSNNNNVPLQLYQAIAPRSDPDAVLNALATCPVLQSVRLTHSPYCARDYSVAALARLCNNNSIRECSIVTRVSNWAPLLAQINNSANSTAGSLERLVLTTAEHGLTSVDTLGPVALHLDRLRLRQLSLRFWGGPFQPLHDTCATLANALRVNPCLRIFELSEGRRSVVSTTSTTTTTTQDNNLELNVPPKVILPATTHPSLRDSDFAFLESALRDNPRLQLRLDVGIAEAHEDAYDCVRIESNLNAMGRFSAVSLTNRVDHHNRIGGGSDSWFEAFSTLERLCENDAEEFLQSCLFRFLRCNPQYWCR